MKLHNIRLKQVSISHGCARDGLTACWDCVLFWIAPSPCVPLPVPVAGLATNTAAPWEPGFLGALSLTLLLWLDAAWLLSDPSTNFCCKAPDGKKGGEAEFSDPAATFLRGAVNSCCFVSSCTSTLLLSELSCVSLLPLQSRSSHLSITANR